MFCIKCGAQLHDGAKFCANCGAVIGRTGASATPIDNTPKVETPKVETPRVETPKVETPVVETPKVETPKVETPVIETPIEEAPVVETPIAEPPKVEEPVVIEDGQPEQPITEKQVASAAYQEFHAADPDNTEAPKKKKGKAGKVIAIIAIILAAVMVLGVAAGAVCYFAFFRSDLNEEAAQYAYVDSNGKGYLCYGDGKVVELGKNISSACMSPDKKKIVVVGTDGLVYWTDAKLSEETEIIDLKLVKDDECWIDIEHLTNDFIVLSVEDERSALAETYTYYRYAFEDDKLVELVVERSALKATEESTEVEYAFGYSAYVNEVAFAKAENGQIRVLRPDSNKFEKIAVYNTDVEIFFCGVSNDGNTVSWMEISGSKYTVMVYTDEDVENVASGIMTETFTDYFYMYSDPNSKVFTILGDNKAIFVKDGTIDDVTFNGKVIPYSVVTTNCLDIEEDAKAKSALGFFVSVWTGDRDSCDVYVVDFEDADKTRLISGISHWTASDGKLLYIDATNTLYVAGIDLGALELVDKNKISTGIELCDFSATKLDYVYFIKNYNEKEETGDLYVYDVKNDDDEKIESNVSAKDLLVSEDGRYVYYFTSVKKNEEYYVSYGDFNVYDAKSGESEEIDDDVIVYSVWSTTTRYGLDPKCIWYEQHSGASGKGYKYDVCFYNGKETTAVVDGMIQE